MALEKIRIYKPHTHAGLRIEPGPDGVEIEVTPADAAFLRAAGVTVPVQSVGVAPAAISPPVEAPAANTGFTPKAGRGQ